MSEIDVKYKDVDKSVYGEVKEIKLIGEDNQLWNKYRAIGCHKNR